MKGQSLGYINIINVSSAEFVKFIYRFFFFFLFFCCCFFYFFIFFFYFFFLERLKNALEMLRNTAPFDVSGHPALSINAGFSEGLPVGMMIIGKHFDEASVLQVAYAFEKLRDGK